MLDHKIETYVHLLLPSNFHFGPNSRSVCSLCTKRSSSIKKLREHIDNHHPEFEHLVHTKEKLERGDRTDDDFSDDEYMPIANFASVHQENDPDLEVDQELDLDLDLDLDQNLVEVDGRLELDDDRQRDEDQIGADSGLELGQDCQRDPDLMEVEDEDNREERVTLRYKPTAEISSTLFVNQF